MTPHDQTTSRLAGAPVGVQVPGGVAPPEAPFSLEVRVDGTRHTLG